MEFVSGRGDASRQLQIGVRIALVVACAVLGAVQVANDNLPGGQYAVTISAVALIAVGASLPLRNLTLTRYQPVAEATVAAAVMAVAYPVNETFLPYLLAPALAAGLVGGFLLAIMTTGLAALVLLLGGLLHRADEAASTARVSQWVLIMLAVSLLAAWVRRLQVSRHDPETESYAAAYRLLSQLRVVSRQLSGGLDATTLSQSLLQSLQAPLGYDRGAVYVRSPGGVLVPYAVEGAEQVEWDTDLSGDSPLADAWSSQRPVVAARPLSEALNGHTAVLPLHIGVRTIGLVALERADPFPLDQVASSAELANEAALRLETALLFTEVREIATAEERRRVAREIHDGIAQELASLGYFVDHLTAREQEPDQKESLVKLRQELSRVINELRLSIFDLRSDVQQSVGLGTALSDYLRNIGEGSRLHVYLHLDESQSARLPIETEAELLRIAQEAVTNARKHAGAQNLWVTCRIDAPSALLRVEDDGRGLQTPRRDSFGLEIMRERAARIGAVLEVKNRGEGGTCVELILGDPGNVAGDDRPAA